MIATALDWLRNTKRTRLVASGKMSADLALGRRGEDLAHRHLRRQGYTIVARNYRLAAGDAEADLIAREGDDLVIVEVKTRGSLDYGPPDRAIGPDKQRHLMRVAREYARKTDTPWEMVRFDVVTVVMRPRLQISLFRSAFHNPR